MSEIGYDLVKLLAVLAQGRSPILVPQSWVYGVANGPPVGLNDGVDVDGALLAKVGVRLRRSADKWRSYYRVDTATEAGEYGFLMLVNNVRVTAGVGETPATIIAALKAAADADLAFGPTWGGEATIVDGHTDVLEIAWPVEGYLVGQKYDDSGDGEAGASIISEATSAVWRLWGLPLGIDQWVLMRDFGGRRATQAFELEDIPVAGWRRLYVEILGADGICLPLVGPARSDVIKASLLEDAAVQIAAAESGLYVGIPVGNDGGEALGATALEFAAYHDLPAADLEKVSTLFLDTSNVAQRRTVVIGDVPEAAPAASALVRCGAWGRGVLRLYGAHADTTSITVEVYEASKWAETPRKADEFTISDFTLPTEISFDLGALEGIGFVISAMTDTGSGDGSVVGELALTNKEV